MNRILYATDFSTNSVQALKYAFELRNKTDGELIIVHTADIPTLWKNSQAETMQGVESSISAHNLKKLKEFYKEHTGGNESEEYLSFEVREDRSTANSILNMAQDFNVDLVVLGVKGKSKLKEILMGSTAKSIIEKAKCTVLTVPTVAQYNDFKHILYAADFNENDIEVISNLTSFAKIYDATITITHVSTLQETDLKTKYEWFKEKLKERIKYPKIEFQILLSDNINNKLQEFFTENAFDLIVMLAHKHNWIHGDHVKNMEFHTTIPLMSYHEKNIPFQSKLKIN